MLTIRPATEEDFPRMLDIQREAFGEYAGLYKTSGWTTEKIEDVRRDAAEKRILVAEWEGAVGGSVRYWTVGGVCVIRLLSVSPALQGRAPRVGGHDRRDGEEERHERQLESPHARACCGSRTVHNSRRSGRGRRCARSHS